MNTAFNARHLQSEWALSKIKVYFVLRNVILWTGVYFAYWVIVHVFCRLLIILFKIFFFSRNSITNTIIVSNSLDPDQAGRLSDLIWVQTVCKGYQQTALFFSSRHRVNIFMRLRKIHWETSCSRRKKGKKKIDFVLSLIDQIIPSALYVCCIYSNALQTNFIWETNTMNPQGSSLIWFHIVCNIGNPST